MQMIQRRDWLSPLPPDKVTSPINIPVTEVAERKVREGIVREGSLKVIMGLSFQRVNGGLLGQQLISELALQ